MKLTVEEIARVCQEVNRAYCLSQGDFSHRSWDQAEQWQRESIIAGVKFHLANPDATPAESHQAWLDHKEKEGWKYGHAKDAAKKEHPAFLPFSSLPLIEQAKDHIITAIVNTLQTI